MPSVDALIRRSVVPMLLATCLVWPAASWAAECNIDIKPRFRGFGLNPVVDKVLVSGVRPARPGAYCPARIGDEILQVNAQRVPGQRAFTVLRYWRSLKKGTPRTYRIRRGGDVIAFTL